PQRRVCRLVAVVDIGKARPVEAAGVGDGAAQRVAVAADVFGQRVDDEARTDHLWTKQVRRGHRIVDNVDQTAHGAELADALQVGDLRTRIRDGLDKDEPCGR